MYQFFRLEYINQNLLNLEKYLLLLLFQKIITSHDRNEVPHYEEEIEFYLKKIFYHLNFKLKIMNF